MLLNEHRKKMNANFEKRREVMITFGLNFRNLEKTDFDKKLEEAETECH